MLQGVGEGAATRSGKTTRMCPTLPDGAPSLADERTLMENVDESK
jgi:hypothetical protein